MPIFNIGGLIYYLKVPRGTSLPFKNVKGEQALNVSRGTLFLTKPPPFNT